MPNPPDNDLNGNPQPAVAELEEQVSTLQQQIQVLEAKLRAQRAAEQTLRTEVKEREDFNARNQALIVAEMQKRIEELERKEAAARASAVDTTSDTALHLKATERRLRDQELLNRRLTYQVQDKELEVKKLEVQLEDHHKLQDDLLSLRIELGKEKDLVTSLKQEMKTKEVMMKEAVAKAVELAEGSTPEDQRAMVQGYIQQLNEELGTVRGELQQAREQLQRTHTSAMRIQEDSRAVALEREARQLDLQALTLEVNSKREVIIKLETDILATEGKMTDIRKESMKVELHMKALQEQQEGKIAEVARTQASVEAVTTEVKIMEQALVDLKRKSIILQETIDEQTARINQLGEEMRFKEGVCARLTQELPQLLLSAAEQEAKKVTAGGQLEAEKPKDTTDLPQGQPPVLPPAPELVGTLFLVTIISGKDLGGIDGDNKLAPFLVLRMGNQAKRTRINRGTKNPVWNETFCFEATSQRLEFVVWSDDLSSNYKALGTGYIHVDEQLLVALSRGSVNQWVPLMVKGEGSVGGINVVLQAGAPKPAPAPPPAVAKAEALSATATPTTDATLVTDSTTAAKTVEETTVESTQKVTGIETKQVPAPPAPEVPAPTKTTLVPTIPDPFDGPSGPYVDYHEKTSREPSLHFVEPDLKYLHIRLHEGVMPIMDFDGQCDPFVKVETGFMEWKSSIQRETLVPQWNEEAIIGCYNLHHLREWGLKLPEELLTDEVIVTAYNWNPARDRRIGFIRLKFKDIPGYDCDDILEPPVPHWYDVDRHFGILTMVVNTGAAKWLASMLFDEKLKKLALKQKRKLELVRNTKKPEAGSVSKSAAMVAAVAKVTPIAGAEEAEEEEIDDEEAEAALAGAHDVCTVKAQVWFDNTYTPPPMPIIGQLIVKPGYIRLQRRDFGQPRAPLMIINYGRHWVRLPSMFGNLQNNYDQEFTFGVRDPSDVLSIAIFDDMSDQLIGTVQTVLTEPKFLGLARIRSSVLGTNSWYKAELPIYQRLKSKVKQRGEMSVSLYFHTNNVAPLIVTMFKPPLKDQWYYAPLKEFKSDFQATPADFETPIRVIQHQHLLELLGDQDSKNDMNWQPSAVKKMLCRPEPELDMDLFKGHFKRLEGSFDALVRFGKYLDEICEWKDFKESLTVNIVLVLLVCYIEWAPTIGLLWLLCSFIKGFKRRQTGFVVPPMESELFGEVIPFDPQASMMDMVNPLKLMGSSKAVDMEEIPVKEEEETQSPFEEIRALVQKAIEVQEAVGEVASLVERIESMPSWMDPRISGLLSIVFVILIPVLYYVPLKLVVCFAVLFVLRHPALRDPIPPPPVNLVLRLPSRAELLLPGEGGNPMMVLG